MKLMEPELKGKPFGTHRVVLPAGALPQAAFRLDNSFERRWDNEIVVDVETLNIDAASFLQIESVSGGDVARICDEIRRTVDARGKQHNEVTDSGGMLLGTVAYIGSALRPSSALVVGDRVATLASLSLTPLAISEVFGVRRASGQVDVRGHAAIFEGAPFTKIAADLPERLSLAMLDVAGAPVQVRRRTRANMSVAIIGGGGKSGLVCALVARRGVGPLGRVVALESHEPYARDLRSLSVCDEVIDGDATDAVASYEALLKANGGSEFDLAICCVNVDRAEMATILPVREGGCAYFFSMTTSFGRAALGAEGVGKDVDLIIGNGYARGHADYAVQLLRDEPGLREVFQRRYG